MKHVVRMRDGKQAPAEFRYLGTALLCYRADGTLFRGHTAWMRVTAYPEDVPPGIKCSPPIVEGYAQVATAEAGSVQQALAVLAADLTRQLRAIGYEPPAEMFD